MYDAEFSLDKSPLHDLTVKLHLGYLSLPGEWSIRSSAPHSPLHTKNTWQFKKRFMKLIIMGFFSYDASHCKNQASFNTEDIKVSLCQWLQFHLNWPWVIFWLQNSEAITDYHIGVELKVDKCVILMLFKLFRDTENLFYEGA